MRNKPVHAQTQVTVGRREHNEVETWEHGRVTTQLSKTVIIQNWWWCTAQEQVIIGPGGTSSATSMDSIISWILFTSIISNGSTVPSSSYLPTMATVQIELVSFSPCRPMEIGSGLFSHRPLMCDPGCIFLEVINPSILAFTHATPWDICNWKSCIYYGNRYLI